MSDRKKTRIAILNVVGLCPRHIGVDTPFISEFAARDDHSLTNITPLLPAVTSTMQATFLTGKTPTEHGIVGNYWYDRPYAEHRGWKQSNRLVSGDKIWETMRKTDPDYTCAKVFWWNNLYSTADYQITPRPIYCANGKKVFDFQTWPLNLHKKMKRKLGKFPFSTFWGPNAGIDSSRWIAKSAKWFEEKFSPDLNLVYLPHLDYNLQRIGPEDPKIAFDLKEIDDVVKDLTIFFEKRGVQVILLSEYGITQVDRPIHINRIFREKGWIVWRNELGRETIDLGNCKAFAIPDHQLAHIYLNDPSILNEVKNAVRNIEGVTDVFSGEEIAEQGLDHERSGDLVAVCDSHSWFTYFYWNRDRKAPDYAKSVDIHRKPGYDPLELTLNPKIRFPKLKIAGKLICKALGFRMLMDVIPLDATLIKGSHGCIPEDKANHPILIGNFPSLSDEETIRATDVHRHLLEACGSE